MKSARLRHRKFGHFWLVRLAIWISHGLNEFEFNEIRKEEQIGAVGNLVWEVKIENSKMDIKTLWIALLVQIHLLQIGADSTSTTAATSTTERTNTTR